VKVLFDTSVIIAALVVSHEQHTVCVHWLNQAKTQQIQGVVSTHTFAETYSVITRLPVRPRINPELAQRQISINLQSFEAVPLAFEDYQAAITQMVSLNLPGGGIYDALIAQAALKGNAEVLLTLNAKHFTRLGAAIASLVQIPQ
jgi:predicted nucleic acid-binding protein